MRERERERERERREMRLSASRIARGYGVATVSRIDKL